MNKPITDTSKHRHNFIFATIEQTLPAYWRSLWICKCGAMRQQSHADDGIVLMIRDDGSITQVKGVGSEVPTSSEHLASSELAIPTEKES